MQGTSIDQIGQRFSALEKTKVRFVVQKAQKMLAAPTGGCKKLRETRSGAQKGSAPARAWKYPVVHMAGGSPTTSIFPPSATPKYIIVLYSLISTGPLKNILVRVRSDVLGVSLDSSTK